MESPKEIEAEAQPEAAENTLGRKKLHIGEREVVTHGLRRKFLPDIYHYAMLLSWPAFFLGAGMLFILINLFFGSLYLAHSDAIANLPRGNFGLAFFFSVQTLATVGYGDMHPQTLYGHAISALEIFIGMSALALFTGLIFARFSKPRARIIFAKHPVVGLFDGCTTLTIRVANARRNVIVDATAKLRLIRSERSSEGAELRRVHDLPLLCMEYPVFLLGWDIMHAIDENSPLHGETDASMADSESMLVLTIQGIDETTSQPMQTRTNYVHHALRWGHRYVDVLSTDAKGVEHFDYARFQETEPVSV